MRQIDESRLENDLIYRFQYLCEFIGLTDDDVATIHGAAPLLAPLVPGLVDAVYRKLHERDATWRHFLPRQHGYDGPIPANLAELTPEHPQIAFRKQHLGRYLAALVNRPYDASMVQYLDMVGKIHTPAAGSKELNVPLIQMNALLGFVADAVFVTIAGLGLDPTAERRAQRAFGKLLWVQNDLIARHYQREG